MPSEINDNGFSPSTPKPQERKKPSSNKRCSPPHFCAIFTARSPLGLRPQPTRILSAEARPQSTPTAPCKKPAKFLRAFHKPKSNAVIYSLLLTTRLPLQSAPNGASMCGFVPHSALRLPSLPNHLQTDHISNG